MRLDSLPASSKVLSFSRQFACVSALLGLPFLGACSMFSPYKAPQLANQLQPQRDRGPAKANPKEGSKAHLALSVNYFQDGQFDQAQTEAATAVKLDSSNSEAQNMLGIVAMAQKNYPVAVEQFDKALKQNPKNADAMNNLASAYCRVSRFDEGVQLYGKAMATPGYTQINRTLVNAALCLQRKPDFKDAQAFLTAARKNDPSDVMAIYQLALLDLRAAQPRPALIEIDALHRRQAPNSASLWLQYLAARQLGDTNTSARASAQLQNLFPRSGETDKLLRNDLSLPPLD